MCVRARCRHCRNLFRSVAAAAALLTLAGCAELGDLSTGAERSLVERRQVGDFSIEFANADRALFVAAGREVQLRPAPGFCIAPESVDVGPASGFAMIGDCPADEAADGTSVDIPRAIPAILTVSIAEEPMFARGSPRGEAISDLERFLTTPEGLATVGRSGASGTVSLVETRAIGNALYVHVEDRDVSALPMFAARFWRAFVELNGRMVLVSLSGFTEAPLESEQMLAHLAAQVGVLRQANGVAVPPAEAELAAGADLGAGVTLAITEPSAPDSAPSAPARPDDGRTAVTVDVAAFETADDPTDDTGNGTGGADAPLEAAAFATVLPDPDAGGAAPPTRRAPDVAPVAPERP